MKKIIKSSVFIFALSSANFAKSQTTVYADTVLAVSNEYGISDATCSNSWAACRILGAPDVYPSCGDIPGAWTFPCGTSRQWIEIGYATQLFVDTVRIYETNHSGAIDTVYLRNAATGNWNTIYAAPNSPLYACNVFDIIIPTTAYKVDAVRIAIADYSLGWCYPELDAVTLIGSTTGLGIIEHNISKASVFPNPSNGQITIKLKQKGFLEIYNLVGEKVLEKIIASNETIQELSFTNAGTYICKFSSNNEIDYLKFIITK